MSIGRVSLNTNNQTNFTDINNALQPGRTGYGQKRHLRMDGGNELYAKYPHAPKGNQAALRLQKKRNAATFVATAIDREYGQGTADYVFAKLQNSNGLNFRANGIRRGELDTIQQELDTITRLEQQFIIHPHQLSKAELGDLIASRTGPLKDAAIAHLKNRMRFGPHHHPEPLAPGHPPETPGQHLSSLDSSINHIPWNDQQKMEKKFVDMGQDIFRSANKTIFKVHGGTVVDGPLGGDDDASRMDTVKDFFTQVAQNTPGGPPLVQIIAGFNGVGQVEAGELAREIGRAIANMPAGVREPLGKRFMLFRQIHSTQVSRLAVDDTLRQANGTSRLFIHEHARHPNKRFEVDLLQGGGVALDIHQPHGLVKRADKEADHAALTENLVDTWINVDTRIVFGPAMDAQMIQNNIN